MKRIDLAVIIPTLNEEHYIGTLLHSIALQTVQPKEIVIVDATSSDDTIEEIKKWREILPQLRFYQIPKYTIARQRNFGVSKTSTDHLLFLDADMILLEEDTLEKYYQEILERNPDIAVAVNYPYSDYWIDKSLFLAMEISQKTLKPIRPIALGMNTYFKRQIFEKVKGYNEELSVGEDQEIVQRITKKRKGKFILLKEPRVYTSVRRLRKVGRAKFATQMTLSFICDMFLGFKKNPLVKNYEFGNHTP